MRRAPGSFWLRLAIAAGAVGVVVAVVFAIVKSWEREAWTAIAAWATAGIALAAGLIARGQLAEARRLRAQQAQPYVVVLMELSRPHSQAIDLVVKNVGKTAAHDVRLTIEPKPQRTAGGEVADLWLPDKLPVLVPEQEWRTRWDMTTARAEGGLPERDTAVVTYTDTHGAPYSLVYV